MGNNSTVVFPIRAVSGCRCDHVVTGEQRAVEVASIFGVTMGCDVPKRPGEALRPVETTGNDFVVGFSRCPIGWKPIT
jgi:hypothetical protein